MDLPVHRAVLQQFIMGADACHPPFVQHNDLVGVLDGADTLGNDQYSCIFCQRFAQRRIRFKVQR